MIIFIRQWPLGYRVSESDDHEADNNRCDSGYDETHTQRMTIRTADKQIGVQR